MNEPSQATPHVFGRRVLLQRYGGNMVLGEFSCHWAAVAALVRLSDPSFRSIGGDKPEDLAAEVGMPERLAAARLQPSPRGQGRSLRDNT